MSIWYSSFFSVVVSLVLMWFSSFFPQVNANRVVLKFPMDNEVLQGEITITGNTDVIGFESYELVFMYENGTNDGDTFFIMKSDVPVKDGVLGTWKTNEISDGNYRLLLIVNYEDDKPVIETANNLRVRNYTPVEEDEALPAVEESEPLTADEQIAEETKEPEVQRSTLFGSMLRGMLYTVIVIVVLGLAIFGYTQTRRRR
ncbi:MAG: hypothetical protein HPY85_01655 [Anaerolineae bacterium]|nr:hypothetical protein [Anaerolineae bacterium]